MRVSTIIPVINEQSLIAEAICCAWQSGADEVIVVDGGSVDDTKRRAQSASCTFVSSEPGRARQQNVGAGLSTGDVLCFLHADNRPGASALGQVRQAMVDDRIVFGAFRQRINAEGLGYRLLEIGNALRVQVLGCPYGDQGIFVRAKVFHEIGGFPETPILEDLLLSRRLRRIRWPILLPGPLQVSARRWSRFGIARQTMRNWKILLAHRFGVPLETLATWYRRHDQ